VLPSSMLLRGIFMGWAAKVLVEIITLPITYFVVRFLKDAESIDYYDYNTDFNPFLLR